MAKGLRVGKSLVLPRTDNITDTEIKKVIDELIRVIEDINFTNFNDHILIDDTVKVLDGVVSDIENRIKDIEEGLNDE